MSSSPIRWASCGASTTSSDLELTPSVEQTIADWTVDEPLGRTGTHHYTAEQFGLSDAQLRDDYRFYTATSTSSIEGTTHDQDAIIQGRPALPTWADQMRRSNASATT